MDKEEVEIVKETIKMLVEDHIDSQINYEWEGSDFTERIMDNLPIDRKMSFDRIVQKDESRMKFDNQVYQKFLKHVTDFIYESLEFETEED
jgi:hypothetical protein